jgi:carboxymethylenebutenolidase
MSVDDQMKELNHLQRYLVEEYVEDYQEGAMSRRQALKYIAAVLGSVGAASTLLAGCVPSVAQPVAPTIAPRRPGTPVPTTAQVTAIATQAVLATTATIPTSTAATAVPGVGVPPDDPTLEVSAIQFEGQNLTLIGYLARPKGDGPFPAIVVAHENRGLTDYIKDVTRRLAKAGYVALAVDLLSSQGGTDKITDPSQIPATLSGKSPDELAGYYLSGIAHLQGLPYVSRDHVGMVGFCFGGGMTWLVATKAPELKAAVPYYGPNPPLDEVPNIRAAVLAIYGGDDARIDAGIPAIEEAMKQNNKTFEKIIYPGAAHAFHNDTGRNYKPDAAADAWSKTLAWFARYV